MVNNYSVSLTSRFSAIDAHVLRYRDLAVRDGSCRLRVIGHRLCADILLHHATSLVSELNRFRIIKLIIIFQCVCLTIWDIMVSNFYSSERKWHYN